VSQDRPLLDDAVRRRLDDYLAEHGLRAVWFGRANSFAWLLGGDNTVDASQQLGVAAVGYDGDDVTVVTSDIEAGRLAEEELPEGVPVEPFAWHETDLADAVAETSARPAAADFPVGGFDRVDVTALRQPLTERDLSRYRRLGQEVAAAVEAVCREVSPSTTERDAAAQVTGRLAEHGIDTPVVLVGGARRAQRYRHFVPRDDRLGEYALVSVTARRDGLNASCTRTVAFDPPAWLCDRHEAAARVDATALTATRAVGRDGGTAGDVFAAIRDAYAAVGHPDEWREHHQGGAAGYAGREWIATPDSDEPVHLPMAYAWNPTVEGAKSEDTIVVTSDGFETLTATGDWPIVEVAAVDGGPTLERHAILRR
jgi:Xaa-Pro aminopeptidase